MARTLELATRRDHVRINSRSYSNKCVIKCVNLRIYFRKATEEASMIRRKAAAAGTLPVAHLDVTESKTLKPVPVTTTGLIGWLASKFVGAQFTYLSLARDFIVVSRIRPYKYEMNT